MRREATKVKRSQRIAMLVGGIVVLTGLVFSSSAMADRHGLVAEIDFKASDGYHVSILAHRWRHQRSRAEVGVSVSNDFAYSSYTVPGLLTSHRLKANLGSFGKIALRYHPSARRSPLERLGTLPPAGSLITRFFQQFLGCAVGGEVERGHFKGRIRFRGEDGYVRIHAHHARGFITPAAKSCSKVRRVHGVALDAKAGSVAFEADHLRGQPGAAVLAREREQSGRVTIRRLALGGGKEGSFTYDSGLTSAHVDPDPGLFSGSADLNPAGKWTGPLAVSFPGAPDVPLAGTDFTAALRRF